jgi:hypothetical protein
LYFGLEIAVKREASGKVETDWFTREFFVENFIDIFVGGDVRHVVIKYYGSVIGSSGDFDCHLLHSTESCAPL